MGCRLKGLRVPRMDFRAAGLGFGYLAKFKGTTVHDINCGNYGLFLIMGNAGFIPSTLMVFEYATLGDYLWLEQLSKTVAHVEALNSP